MSGKVYTGKIPYWQGNMMHYPQAIYVGYPGVRTEPEWRDNDPFTVDMHIEGYARGRSAAYFELKDTQGFTYPLFLTDIMGVIESCVINSGWIRGKTWAGCKRGTNFGIRIVQ